jgi:hypothetical protein
MSTSDRRAASPEVAGFPRPTQATLIPTMPTSLYALYLAGLNGHPHSPGRHRTSSGRAPPFVVNRGLAPSDLSTPSLTGEPIPSGPWSKDGCGT